MKLKPFFACIVFLLLYIQPLFSANVVVPVFELYTRGALQNSSFILQSRGNLEFQIEGGYKFGGKVILDFFSESLETLSQNSTAVNFKSASVTVREMIGLPLDLTYFVGELDPFSTGEQFPLVFGSDYFTSNFKGFIYFPTTIQYEGIHTVNGTGLKFSLPSVADWYYPSFYLYQDMYFSGGLYSIDLLQMLNFDNIKIETFLGMTFPSSTLGIYRAGVLFYLSTGDFGSFYAQIGIPKWEPGLESISMEHFYFMFEPRINLGDLTIISTLFWHPKYYLQKATNENGFADINLNFLLGSVEEHNASGGIEATFGMRPSLKEQFTIKVSPYLHIVGAGAVWDFKLNFKLFPPDFLDLANSTNVIEVIAGVHASY